MSEELFPEQESPEPEAKPRVTARTAVLAGARVAGGLVGLGVVAVTIAAVALLPLPTVGSAPASVVVQPVPTAQQQVCPGAVLRLSDEAGQDATSASALGNPAVFFDASSGRADSAQFEQSDAGTGATRAAPTLISTPPSDSGSTEPPLLSGAQAQAVEAGEFVGLAAATCGVATGETWLAAGATTVGRTTLLTLSNPTEVPATVDLALYGERGRVIAPGTSGIVVAPRGQRVLSLAGFQPDLESPVLHITSRGGLVVANLQQSVVRGLVAGGLDLVGSSAPSVSNVIPGLAIVEPTQVQALLGGGPGFLDVRTTLRLFVPGEEDTAATVQVIPVGDAEGASFELELAAGRVLDVPIEELEAGSYTVRVDSEHPVVAGLRFSTASGEVTDFAWAAAAPELRDRAQVTIAEGVSPLLHLYNPGTEEVTLEALGVVLPPGGSAALPVSSGDTISLNGFDRLYASVSFAGEGQVAHYTVQPPGVASGPITIYP